MGEQSAIQWTGATWNPWHGCDKVSAGCKYCYMYRDKVKFGQDPSLVVRSKGKFNEPLKWEDPKVVFTCSWSDWFIDKADQWRDEAWDVIRKTPRHTYQILTKRSDRIKNHLPADWGEGWQHVWLGVTVENQEATSRIRELQQVPAHIRFLSVEPILERVDLGDLTGIDWVIVGGESGNDNGEFKYRPCELWWLQDIVDQCAAQGVKVFVKQMGTYISKTLNLKDRHGGEIEEFPEPLKIRQMPEHA
jgi:protein gp37